MREESSASAGLAGRTVLVSGAESPLGQAIARDLAQKGAKLALIGGDGERLAALADAIAATDGRALPVVACGSDPEGLDQAFTIAETELGPLRVLIAVARAGAAVQPGRPGWDRDLGTATADAWHLTRRAARAMMAHGHGGQILHLVPDGATAPGAALRGGLAELVTRTAADFLDHRISVNLLTGAIAAGDDLLPLVRLLAAHRVPRLTGNVLTLAAEAETL